MKIHIKRKRKRERKEGKRREKGKKPGRFSKKGEGRRKVKRVEYAKKRAKTRVALYVILANLCYFGHCK
jgi:uncharacterized membrane protein YkvA (DUF1232 family)